MHYDASGNMDEQSDAAKKQKKEIAYDSSNRITKVTNPTNGKTVGDYEYDDQGFRVRKVAAEIINGAETQVEVLYPSMYFAIEKQRNSIGVEIPNTSYAVNNIYINGIRVAASMANGSCQYYLTDQVDSVNVVTDDEAQVVNRFEYLPYGESWITEGDGKNRPKYNSQELDAETGFYFFNARYYDGEIGRFVTADNKLDGEYMTQGWNRYMYCHGNPIIYKDPTGHDTVVNISNDEHTTRGSREAGNYVQTYNAYVYKDSALMSAETKYKIDKTLSDHGIKRKMYDATLEVTRQSQKSGENHYGEDGSMPPTKGDKPYIVRKGLGKNNIEKYRIGEKEAFPENPSSTAANSLNIIHAPESGSPRSLFNFDPYNKRADLKGCIGVTNPKRPTKEDDSSNWGTGTANQFANLNKYLEKVIPDLQKVNMARKDGGQVVKVYVDDLYKKLEGRQ